MGQRFEFPHTLVTVEPGLVRTHFLEHDIFVDCDIEGEGKIAVAFPSTYRGYARYWGYGDEWRRYAYHHDLTHTALSEWTADQCSPTLLAAAKGEKWAFSAHEEYAVNIIQWTLATGDYHAHQSYLKMILGEQWLAEMERIENLLASVEIPEIPLTT